MRTGLALALVLGLASIAPAALVTAAGNDPAAVLQVQYEATALGGGLTSYAVYVVGPTGEKMSSFDGRFDGVLYQAHPSGAGTASGWATDLQTPEMAAMDSHLLFSQSDAAVVRGPTAEDNDASQGWVQYGGPTPPIFYAEEGLGTYLGADDGAGGATTMAMGILGTAQADSFLFAQLIIPDGELVTMTGSLGIASGGGQAIGLGGNGVIIPEPATIGMLLIGSLGLIARRRRS